MTEYTTISTPETSFANPIASRFFEHLDAAAEEIRQNGKLSSFMIEKILGKAPVVSDSPDNDARMEAYEELALYSTRVLNIEEKVRTYAGVQA